MHGCGRTAIFFSLLLLSLFPISGWSSYGPTSRNPQRIPREAYDACEGKGPGDSVVVILRRGKLTKEIKAICSQYDGEKQLLAVPETLFKVTKSTANNEELSKQQ